MAPSDQNHGSGRPQSQPPHEGGKSRPWSKREDRAIHDGEAARRPRKDTAKALSRSTDQVDRRARILGYNRGQTGAWSPAEMAVIADAVARGLQIDEIEPRIPGRSRVAIRNKVCRVRCPAAPRKPIEEPALALDRDAELLMLSAIMADGGFPRANDRERPELPRHALLGMDGKPWRRAA